MSAVLGALNLEIGRGEFLSGLVRPSWARLPGWWRSPALREQPHRKPAPNRHTATLQRYRHGVPELQALSADDTG